MLYFTKPAAAKLVAALLLSFLLSTPAFAETYYVCNNGDDTSLGTVDHPWATFDYAASKFNKLNAGNDIAMIDVNNRGKTAIAAPDTDEFYQADNVLH